MLLGQISEMGDADEDAQMMECLLRAETELDPYPRCSLSPGEAVSES